MLPRQNVNRRFDPSRFSSEPPVQDRKKVHWASPLSDTKRRLSVSNHSQMNEASSPPKSWYKFYGKSLLSTVPFLLVVLYLSVRDGWIALFLDKLSQTTSDLGAPSWLHSTRSEVPEVPTPTIPPYIRSYVDQEVARVIRSPVPYRDFTLAVDGGYVIGELTVPFGSPCPPDIFCQTNPMNAILEDSRIGQCWFVRRTQCQLALALPEQVRPTFVTVEHIPKEIAADSGQAPRRMVLWGVVEGDDNNLRYTQYLTNFPDALTSGRNAPPLTTDKARWVILSEFTYDIHARNHIQTFPVAQYIRQSNLQFGIVVLEVLDNWGSESLCLYRVRIHGESGR